MSLSHRNMHLHMSNPLAIFPGEALKKGTLKEITKIELAVNTTLKDKVSEELAREELTKGN